jgi:hypothetical protein
MGEVVELFGNDADATAELKRIMIHEMQDYADLDEEAIDRIVSSIMQGLPRINVD